MNCCFWLILFLLSGNCCQDLNHRHADDCCCDHKHSDDCGCRKNYTGERQGQYRPSASGGINCGCSGKNY